MSRTISIKLADDLYKKVKARAGKQYLEVDELIEDILRRSMLSYKKNSYSLSDKADDALIRVFSRTKRTKRKK